MKAKPNTENVDNQDNSCPKMWVAVAVTEKSHKGMSTAFNAWKCAHMPQPGSDNPSTVVGLLCVLVLHPLTWRHGCVIYGTVQWRSFVLSEVETGLARALRGQASQQAHTGPDSTPLEIATGLRTFFFNYRIFREVCLPRIKIVSTVKFEWVNFFALSVNFHEQSFKVVCGVRLAINSITNLVNMAAFRILTEIWFK